MVVERLDGRTPLMPLSVVNVIWLMIVSACLTLGGHVLPGLDQEPRAAPICFMSINALSMAAFAYCELWFMRVETPADGVIALRCAQVALTVWFVSNVWFVKTLPERRTCVAGLDHPDVRAAACCRSIFCPGRR